MARGRMLNRKVGRSQKVASLGRSAGPWAVVFHHRLIANLDINGNCRADRWWLKSEVHPLDDDVSPDDCDRFARALVEYELAVRYEVAGLEYLNFPDFQNEQGQLRRDRETPQVPDIQGRRAVAGKSPGDRPAVGGSQVEVEVKEKEKPLRGQKKERSTKLTKSWSPNEAHARIAAEWGRDLSSEESKFRDWAIATGKTYVDWDAGFRNWLRNDRYGGGARRNGEREKPTRLQDCKTDEELHELLRETLVYVRRHEPDFAGGYPPPTLIDVPPRYRDAWNRVLLGAGLEPAP